MPFLGMRGTGDWVTNQRPESWRDMILYLYPNGKAPLTAILSKMRSQKVDDPVFHWWQQLLPDQRATITGVYTNAGLTVAYVSGGAAGDTIYVKMSEADSKKFRATHQIMLRYSGQLTLDVTGRVSASTQNGADSYLTVVLLEADDNGTGGKDLSDADVAIIIGTINPEGGTSGSSLMYDPTEYSNQTQIWRTPLDHTRTAMRTRLRTGDAVAKARREALEMHSIEMEKSFIFGVKRTETGTNGKPQRTTAGIRSFLSTNKSDYTQQAGTSTWLAGGEDWLDNFFEQMFRYGSNEKLMLAGSGAILGIQRLAKERGTFELTAMKTDYGINVMRWVTAFGTVYLKTHPLFSYEATLRNSALLVEPEHLIYRFIDDTTYKPEIQANDLDGEKSEYLTEAGLELQFEQVHGWLDGIGLANP